MSRRYTIKDSKLVKKDLELTIKRLDTWVVVAMSIFLIITLIVSFSYYLLKPLGEKYARNTYNKEEYSSELIVMTNIINNKKKLKLSPGDVMKEFSPDLDDKKYSLIKMNEVLKSYGINNDLLKTNREEFEEYLGDFWYIVKIDNSSIPYEGNETQKGTSYYKGKGYKENLSICITIKGYTRINGLLKIGIDDPYLSKDYLRLYDIRDLKSSFISNTEEIEFIRVR